MPCALPQFPFQGRDTLARFWECWWLMALNWVPYWEISSVEEKDLAPSHAPSLEVVHIKAPAGRCVYVCMWRLKAPFSKGGLTLMTIPASEFSVGSEDVSLWLHHNSTSLPFLFPLLPNRRGLLENSPQNLLDKNLRLIAIYIPGNPHLH